jgi:tetratricopeptide (TPR) repeat protein
MFKAKGASMVARVVLVILLLATPLYAADAFYEQQLQAGKADFQMNRLAQAVDEFRIAAFGFLQEPPLLSEALARLAVAQVAVGQTAEAAKTIDRFLDVEKRLAPYAQVQLETATRSKFEELVVKQVPRATLQAIPSLARLANYELQKIAQMPATQRIAAYQAGAQREPKNLEWPLALVRETAARESFADVVRWGTKVLELDPANKEVRPLLVRARAARRECREALALIKDIDFQQYADVYADQAVCLAEANRWKEAEAVLVNVPAKLKNRADVRRAFQLVAKANDAAKAEAARLAAAKLAAAKRPVPVQPASGRPAVPQTSSASTSTSAPQAPDLIEAARRLVRDGKYAEATQRLRAALQSDPSNRSVRLSLLESSVLARDWRTAMSQVPVVTPLTSGEELYMFYASVALFESGRQDEAKSFMERARPRMVPSPMVDHYVRAILGAQGRG